MTIARQWHPEQVRAVLVARGFDIEGDDPRYGPQSITGRRERGGQAQLFVVDSGGRFRAEMIVVAGETRRSTMIGAVPIVVLSQTSRTLTITGNLPSWNHLPAVLAQLDQSF